MNPKPNRRDQGPRKPKKAKTRYPNGQLIRGTREWRQRRETTHVVQELTQTIEQLLRLVTDLRDRVTERLKWFELAVQEGIKEALGKPLSLNKCALYVGFRKERVQKALENGQLPAASVFNNKTRKKRWFIAPAAARTWADREREADQKAS